MMKIRYAKVALKALQGYDKPTRERIRDKIQGLTEVPPVGDIKPLSNKRNHYRLRVGKFRVKYEYVIEVILKEDGTRIQEKTLSIIDIDSRGDIYK